MFKIITFFSVFLGGFLGSGQNARAFDFECPDLQLESMWVNDYGIEFLIAQEDCHAFYLVEHDKLRDVAFEVQMGQVIEATDEQIRLFNKYVGPKSQRDRGIRLPFLVRDARYTVDRRTGPESTMVLDIKQFLRWNEDNLEEVKKYFGTAQEFPILDVTATVRIDFPGLIGWFLNSPTVFIKAEAAPRFVAIESEFDKRARRPIRVNKIAFLNIKFLEITVGGDTDESAPFAGLANFALEQVIRAAPRLFTTTWYRRDFQERIKQILHGTGDVRKAGIPYPTAVSLSLKKAE